MDRGVNRGKFRGEGKLIVMTKDASFEIVEENGGAYTQPTPPEYSDKIKEFSYTIEDDQEHIKELLGVRQINGTSVYFYTPDNLDWPKLIKSKIELVSDGESGAVVKPVKIRNPFLRRNRRRRGAKESRFIWMVEIS